MVISINIGSVSKFVLIVYISGSVQGKPKMGQVGTNLSAAKTTAEEFIVAI